MASTVGKFFELSYIEIIPVSFNFGLSRFCYNLAITLMCMAFHLLTIENEFSNLSYTGNVRHLNVNEVASRKDISFGASRVHDTSVKCQLPCSRM